MNNTKLCTGGCGYQTTSETCSFCSDWNERAARNRELDAMQLRSLERSGGSSDYGPAVVILILVAIVAMIL